MLNKKMKQTNESGRSMVEMLGVLAVIGVLSVMGIAGYTQAMKSNKANEITNAVSKLYMMGISQNAGKGDKNLAYADIFGALSTLPNVSALSYNGTDKTISVTITDEDVCNKVLNMFGTDKVTGTCSGASSALTITLGTGETSGGGTPPASCSDTVGDPCNDNSTVCEGYYCSIAGGTTDNDEWCGTDTYTPGSGSVAALGTPNTKGSYKASPSPVASWDAAVNYCDALGRDGLVTHGRLANVPSGCSMGNSCSALPDDDYYWLNGLVQWDCAWENYSTTYGSNSCGAFLVDHGDVNNYDRNYFDFSALCE